MILSYQNIAYNCLHYAAACSELLIHFVIRHFTGLVIQEQLILLSTIKRTFQFYFNGKDLEETDRNEEEE